MNGTNRRAGGAALAVVLGAALGAVACERGPTAPADSSAELLAPASAALAVVPPGTEREILALLARWEESWASMDGNAFGDHYAVDADFVNPLGGILSGRQAIAAQHVFLFSGPFNGSVQTWQVRRMAALTGNVVLVDLNVALTGFVGLPPGLQPTEPGVVRTRGRLLVGKTEGRWEILAQQYTAIAPAP